MIAINVSILSACSNSAGWHVQAHCSMVVRPEDLYLSSAGIGGYLLVLQFFMDMHESNKNDNRVFLSFYLRSSFIQAMTISTRNMQ
jgi:hypothetical protein